MANTNAPFGLRPVRYLSGAPYNGAVNRYYFPSTDSNGPNYIGQLVKPAGSASVDGYMTVSGNVTTADLVLGPIVAIEPVSRDSKVYREDDTACYVDVADDPNLVFEVQDNGASALSAGNVGNTADLTSLTGGSTVTGLSSTVISCATATASGDGTEDVLIVGLRNLPDNEYGTYAKWLVRLNNHFFVDGVAGA